jgi:hypothetical protein
LTKVPPFVACVRTSTVSVQVAPPAIVPAVGEPKGAEVAPAVGAHVPAPQPALSVAFGGLATTIVSGGLPAVGRLSVKVTFVTGTLFGFVIAMVIVVVAPNPRLPVALNAFVTVGTTSVGVGLGVGVGLIG